MHLVLTCDKSSLSECCNGKVSEEALIGMTLMVNSGTAGTAAMVVDKMRFVGETEVELSLVSKGEMRTGSRN